ncbi:MAG: enoyl-CoA hydratase/isomerase family protein [Sphingorhabdus sp.]
MNKLDHYRDTYPYVKIDRNDAGVLTLRFHTDGGVWTFGQTAQDTMARLFRDIADDKDNRIVVVEGTGEEFCTGYIMSEIGETIAAFDHNWSDRWITNGRNVLSAILEVEAPIIWCLNGPVTVHPEFLFGGASIILADPSAYVQDLTHIGGGNMTAGDTLAVWESLLGLGRARYFHLMAEKLDVDQLKALGIVHEIVARDGQRARAEAIAEQLLKLAPLTLRYSAFSINQRLRRFAFNETPPSYGLLGVAALEQFGPKRG